MAGGYDKYVLCKGKVRSSEKGKFYTYDQLLEIENETKKRLDYARIIPEGIVMFDVDKEETAKLLLKILKDNVYHKPLKFNYVKSTRGYHFLFRTDQNTIVNANNKYNWLGIELDIKGVGLEEKDKTSYESMRVGGIDRLEKRLEWQ